MTSDHFGTLRSMLRALFCVVLSLSFSTLAAERVLDFSGGSTNQLPNGFRSLVIGSGKPGNWQVLQDESAATQSSSNAAVESKTVLAQLAREAIDRHFPVLLFDAETFGDFRMTTRFKIVGGALEQAA